jgi:uncharacterized protein
VGVGIDNFHVSILCFILFGKFIIFVSLFIHTTMNPFEIIDKYYNPESDLYHILVSHSQDVARLALTLARRRPDLNPDLRFIEEASLLHDIGIFQTDASGICCHGTHTYICHGFLGAEIMRSEGYPRHALVCERHTGTGLSLDYIESNHLPIPHRDMLPVSVEEQVICYADKFFSKTHLGQQRTVEEARAKLVKFGAETVARFDNWTSLFVENN